MPSNITLELVDGVRVDVPDSLNLITSYVLREQQDWFEDEIKLLRRLIRPGQKVIDIGANCGVYTLTMARLVGSAGRVWAFEPASATANLLASGIASNNFTNVELIRSAVSNVPGTALLSVHEHSELNELVRGQQPAGATETVACVTLDGARDLYGWKAVDFVKIDAEGEETNILRGATAFLAAESPLIQYEIKAAAGFNLDLARQFLELGYPSYRLVPGLGVLVPFDAREPVDGYQLNLFCCKSDRAARLAAQGFLVEASNLATAPRRPDSRKIADGSDAHGWRATLARLPYGALLANEWVQHMRDDQGREVEEPLFHYALSRDPSVPAAERFAALEASYLGFKRLCETQPAHLRLASLARVALDYGARAVAVNALAELCNRVLRQGLSTAEPFLAPGVRFDSISPGNLQSVANWMGAAVLEQIERYQHYSSFYTGMPAVQRLEVIRDLGFGSDEMKRRLTLIRQRFPAGAL